VNREIREEKQMREGQDKPAKQFQQYKEQLLQLEEMKNQKTPSLCKFLTSQKEQTITHA